MAEIKQTLSLLSKRKKALRSEFRRLARALARLLPYRVAFVLAPRPTRRTTRNVTKFEIGGNLIRSVILAPNVQVDGKFIRTIAGGVVITIVIISVVNSTTPNTGKTPLPAFVRGDPYHLDVVIAPFRAANSSDKACEKFAQDFTDRLARTVNNTDSQNVSIWLPEQVAGVFDQNVAEGKRANQFAEANLVDVLFYGDIECDAQKAAVRPHVVAPALFYEGAPELARLYNFDDITNPLQVELTNNSLEQIVRKQATRIATLIEMGRGFRLLAARSENGLRQAAVLFQHLAKAGIVADRHGLAMLQYLAGKALLVSAVDECNVVDPDLLQQAENSFSQALLHEPEFALALANLGNVSVYQARALPDGNTAEIEAMLNKGLSRYQRALDARVQPDDDLATTIAMIGKAQVGIALHDIDPASSERRQMLTVATDQLQEAIRKFDRAGIGNEIKTTVALAYALLGDLNRAGSNDGYALSSYGKAASLTVDRRLQATVAQSTAELYTVRGDACASARQYQIAAQSTCLAASRKFAMQAERMQYFCQQTNDAQMR